MREDGKIIIGTDVDDKEFYNKIKEFETTKPPKFRIEVDPELDEQGLQKEIIEAVAELSKIKNKDIISEDDIIEAKELLSYIERVNDRLEEIGGRKVIISGLNDAKEDAQEIEENVQKIDLSKIEKQANSVGESLQKVTKKVAKWALAVFGVRSAYMAIRKAISIVSQYNDQIKTDIAYIQFALASALEPIIKVVINLAYKLLGIINAISMALFNYNLFGKASVKNFKNMNAGANKLRRTLAGFDEMNILGDNTSASGGAGGMSTPSMEIDTSFGQKFIDYWKSIIEFWETGWIDAINSLTGHWSTFIEGIIFIGKGLYDIFKSIIEAIVGAFKFLVGVFTGDTEMMSEGAKKILQGILDFFTGILELQIGVFKVAIGFIKGLLLDLANVVYNEVVKPIGNFFANLWNKVVSGVKTAFNSITTFFSGIISKIMGMFKKVGSTAGDVIGSAFKSVINAVLKTIEKILNTPIKAINSLIKTINKVPGINLGKLDTFTLPRLAKGGIVNNPGAGVMMGSYIAGERGAEAVLPLTDGTLQRLANMIPITVNVTNSMNGRIISRELQKVQNDSNFAFNR